MRGPMHARPYRPEIDGLRALAVLPVVCFHAGFTAFSGGFVGVDIFFVISGYLITSIITDELAKNEFTLIGFYERRARRLLPALFVVCAASTVGAWIVLPPDQLVDFGKSLVATSLFYSNYYFLSETGYFATASEHLMLLHTWSLAVEEQFYILFPLILIASYALQAKKSTLAVMLALLAVVSLGFAEATSRVEPEVSFFSSHTRAFELLIGAILALNIEKLAALSVRVRTKLAWCGLLILLASFCWFGSVNVHPGVATLIPIAGTVLLIAFAGFDNLPGRILSWRPLVAIGLISYSLYLWHQPVFAFSRLYTAREQMPLEMAFLIALCILLAGLTWRFVERPFRNPRVVSRVAVARAAVALVVLPIAAGVSLVSAGGVPARMGSDAIAALRQLDDASEQRHLGVRSNKCHYTKNSGDFDQFIAQWDCLPEGDAGVLVYGDSHAADKAWALRSAGVMVGNLTGSNCPLDPSEAPPHCLTMMLRVVDLAKRGKISGIVLANRWDANERNVSTLAAIEQFWRHASVPVLMFTGMPEFKHMRAQVAWRLMRHENLSGFKFDKVDLFASNEELRRAFNGSQITLVQTDQLFCGSAADARQAYEGGQPLLVDDGHLSPLGAKRFAERLVVSPEWQTWTRGMRKQLAVQ